MNFAVLKCNLFYIYHHLWYRTKSDAALPRQKLLNAPVQISMIGNDTETTGDGGSIWITKKESSTVSLTIWFVRLIILRDDWIKGRIREHI